LRLATRSGVIKGTTQKHQSDWCVHCFRGCTRTRSDLTWVFGM
jgi:hypothetical protein